jgi:hypothetical protein
MKQKVATRFIYMPLHVAKRVVQQQRRSCGNGVRRCKRSRRNLRLFQFPDFLFFFANLHTDRTGDV